MTTPPRDPSVEHEPHRRDEPHQPDPAEARTQQHLSNEQAFSDPDEERAIHSVFNEPSIFPNRERILIDRDWSCRNCGYNLRGLMTGDRCPECGIVERYEPPRTGEVSYATWQTTHQSNKARGLAWLITLAIPLLGIPAGILGAFAALPQLGVVNFILIGSVMTEVFKITGAAILLERRAFMVRSATRLHVMTLGTALAFGVTQNVMLLVWLFPTPNLSLIITRWTAGLMMHLLCTSIATYGLVRVWEEASGEHRMARLSRAYPAIVVAIILHATYNGCLFAWNYGDYGI